MNKPLQQRALIECYFEDLKKEVTNHKGDLDKTTLAAIRNGVTTRYKTQVDKDNLIDWHQAGMKALEKMTAKYLNQKNND